MKILGLESYYGGSHKRFIDQLRSRLTGFNTLLTLPARGWKWRMRLAARHFAQQLKAGDNTDFDLIFTSSILDLPAFRALAPRSIGQLPIVVYWHENQLTYPSRFDDERDHHYALTNIHTALSADLNLFNSQHNRDRFLANIHGLVRAAPDLKLGAMGDEIASKSKIMPVPLDLEADGLCRRARPGNEALILWNHRWEHDKDPETFFAALFRLDDENRPFRLAVAGPSFRQSPAIFAEARQRLAIRIDHWGTVDSRDEYLDLLRRCDLVVSTAQHEFQGLAILEAVAQGATPVLPARLAYPEFFQKPHLYDPGQLTNILRQRIEHCCDPDAKVMNRVAELCWSQWLPRYQSVLENMLGSRP